MSILQNFEIFPVPSTMEDLDECLLLAKLEVSCWKDQLKQAVSYSQFSGYINFQTVSRAKI